MSIDGQVDWFRVPAGQVYGSPTEASHVQSQPSELASRLRGSGNDPEVLRRFHRAWRAGEITAVDLWARTALSVVVDGRATQGPW